MSSTAPLTLHWLRVDFVYFPQVDLFILQEVSGEKEMYPMSSHRCLIAIQEDFFGPVVAVAVAVRDNIAIRYIA